MVLKCFFDRIIALFALLFLWPVLLVAAIMVKGKMPGGPAFFVQKRVGKNGKLFNCHKFRTMTVKHNGSTVSVAGDSRITPFGATLRHYKLDELPGLWDSTHGYFTMIKWHYKLWHEAEGFGSVASLFLTCGNLVCGVYKKLVYVKKAM